MISIEEIKNRLWNGANELRGSMDASRYKDYMLGLMFYKFLSDKTLQAYAKVSNSHLVGKDLYLDFCEKIKSYQEDGLPSKNNRLIGLIGKYLGFYILPEHLFQAWQEDIDKGEFELQKVQDALSEFERNIVSENNINDFKGLFSSMKLTEDAALGSSLKVKNENITALLGLLQDLNLPELQENDIVGDVYEYLIGQFAMESGAKAGEFYTPSYVSDLIANLVALSVKDVKSIYDPAVGSGSLLLKLKNYLSEDQKKALRYYGQEKNTTTYNLCRMNLLLHGVKPENMDIRNGDTLGEDWPDDPSAPGQGILFDAVLMNPPYSLKGWNKAGLNNLDTRFEYVGGILPPDNKGDYAFLAHGLYHLNNNGAMGIVLPHGVLFRGAAEGEIRKKLVEKNCIDAIIGLPAGMFTNTGIPVLVMILRKNRNANDPIIIIDASNQYDKVGKQNILKEKHIAKITDAYLERKEIHGFCHLASKEEIIKNDYNLNIPRYVESSQTEKFPDDVDAHILGGLPVVDIEKLHLLNTVFPDFIRNNYDQVRPGYLLQSKEFSEIKSSILDSDVLAQKKASIHSHLDEFICKYWDKFIHWNSQCNIVKEKEEMLNEIKCLLFTYQFVDAYDGYQLVSELWKVSLNKDLQYIKENGFYEAARLKVPNMVEKGSGSNKHQEQEGFRSAIVPAELIESELMKDELDNIAKLNSELDALTERFEEVKENNLSDSDDSDAILSDYLKDDSEELDRKRIKEALKTIDKDS
ncbi:MAG: type I restriction-modification system subunit M, partial [Succinivibrio sp.]